MIFEASISSFESHNIWRRVVQNLSYLNEDIKLTITHRGLIIWAMNSTETSMSQAHFARSFFDQFHFRPEETVFGEDGLQQVQDGSLTVHKLYSFSVHGKHLAILFRKPENDNITLLHLAIDNTTNCPEALANRLQIKIHTENLMVKEYAPHIVPQKYDPIVIELRYKRRFLDVYCSSRENNEEQLDPRLLEIFGKLQRELETSYFNSDFSSTSKRARTLRPEDEINYLCCNRQLLKNFIDSCSTSNTEEAKLEVSIAKLSLTAFTKGVYTKNNDVLRNAMRATNVVATNDLEHYCLFTNSQDEPTKRPLAKGVTFGMKGLKNFVNTATMWKDEKDVNIWFCRPGEPILMEVEGTDLRLELVQVTDSCGTASVTDGKIDIARSSPLKDAASVKLASPRKSPLKYKGPSRLGLTNNGTPSPVKPKSLFSTTEDDSMQEKVAWKNPIRGKRPTTENPIYDTGFNVDVRSDTYSKAQRTRTTVAWGNSSLELLDNNNQPNLDQRDLLKQEKKRFLRDLKRQEESRKHDQSSLEDQFGPTQKDKPKGLFD
ncbi:LADA_0G02498g1_1 [Lachancea dasiensis]|uniref:LADA_0G02498g1_1 n=1 Tax=Lachancea dasiensis TaxID=1072105 RepID=A0A1G4JRH3_9SACH|nr:LADA_0G02498g1_1 [Lachancea dasiensis]